MVYFVLIIIAVSISGSFGECPTIGLVSPCNCWEDMIYCQTLTDDLDLLEMFKKLSESQYQKHYKGFYLRNILINELKANTFGRITFEDINIEYCSNLTSIHRNAFNGTNMVTNMLSIYQNEKLSSPDNSIFEVMSEFTNATKIYFGYNDVRVIPNNAFKPINGYQDKLQSLDIYGGSIEEIGENAFYNLNSLTHLSIGFSNIGFLPSHAFNFKYYSNKTLELDLSRTKFIQTFNISKNALISLKRPINLWIDLNNYYKIKYLDETIFHPFLLDNKLNKIFTQQLLDCQDCRNFWLKNNSDVQQRINALRCSNGKPIDFPSNFANCTLV